MVIQPTFEDSGATIGNVDAGSFHEGLTRMPAGTDPMREKWGFIDRTGTFQINPTYDMAWVFENGVAAVEVGGKWGFINKKGELVAAAQFDQTDDAWVFGDGLVAVSLKGKYGYIDNIGRLAIAAQFQMANRFRDGFATAAVGTDCSAETFEGGEWIRNQKFDCRWGVIDKAGKFVVSPTYTYARPFSEGLAAVATGSFCSAVLVTDSRGEKVENATRDCKYGYIDARGQPVIAPQFDRAGEFYNGYAVVMVAGACGLIDKLGKYFVSPVYDSALNFDGDLAVVLQGKEIKYINRDRQFVRPHSD